MAVITVNCLYKIFKWTSLYFALITLIVIITRFSVDPIRCTKTVFTSLTLDQIREQCFEEHKPAEEHIFWPYYPRSHRKDTILIYENNYNHFHYILILLTIFSFIGLKGYWHLRYKFKVKDFVLVSTENDKTLLDGFKRNLKVAKKLTFRYYLTFTLIGFAEVATFLLLLSLFTLKDGRFLSIGFEWIGDGFETNFNHLFPRRVNCHVEEQDHMGKFRGLQDYLNCELKLNPFYEIIYLLLWAYFVVLIILMFICLIQLIILSKSESYRLERVRKLLPTIEEQSLVRLAGDLNSYFILEALYSKLDGDRFQKLMKLLIDENYYLDKIDDDVADV